MLERFYRVLGSGEDGSGLGLSIVQGIVELHGGRLELQAGAGSTGLVVRKEDAQGFAERLARIDDELLALMERWEVLEARGGA